MFDLDIAIMQMTVERVFAIACNSDANNYDVARMILCIIG